MRRTCKRKPRQGGFFLLPNEIFTLGLRAGEIAVYAYLLFCEDRETHLCYCPLPAKIDRKKVKKTE